MFRSVFRKSLRDYRVAILGWGISTGLMLAVTMASVSQITATPALRAELVGLASQFAWNAAPVAVDTVGGYAMFKIGIFIFIIAIWPLLAASRALRGEEERGSMDVLLSQPRTRVRVAVEKVAAIWTALLLMGLEIGVLAFAGGQAFAGDFGLGDALLYGLDVALVCTVFAGLTLLISQFTSEGGTAAAWAGGLLVVSIVVDMVHRVFPEADAFSHLSPIYYFNLSKPLVPSYGTNVGALALLAAIGLALAWIAIAIFARRDIGAALPLPRSLRLLQRSPRTQALPVRDWSLRGVYARAMATLIVPTMWWSLLIAGFCAWIIVAVQQIGKQLEDLLAHSPVLQQIYTSLAGGPTSSTNALFLSAMFQVLPVLLMAFVVVQVNGWASDEENGRLDIVLSTPRSRTSVILGRFAAVSTSTIAIGLITLAATLGTARATGVALDGGNVVAASLGMIPLGLLIGALGYLGAGWLRTAADTGLLSLLLAAWLFINLVGRDLGWPDAALRLSAFYYYGNPLLRGIPAENVVGLLAAGALALVIGVYRFARKDIAR